MSLDLSTNIHRPGEDDRFADEIPRARGAHARSALGRGQARSDHRRSCARCATTSSFNMLMDVTAVDWLNHGQARALQRRLRPVLTQIPSGESFRIKAWVPEDDPTIDTVSSLSGSPPTGASARSSIMYGLQASTATPNLKRILLPDVLPRLPAAQGLPGHRPGRALRLSASTTR